MKKSNETIEVKITKKNDEIFICTEVKKGLMQYSDTKIIKGLTSYIKLGKHVDAGFDWGKKRLEEIKNKEWELARQI